MEFTIRFFGIFFALIYDFVDSSR